MPDHRVVVPETTQYGWDRDREPVLSILVGATLEMSLCDASDGQIGIGTQPGDLRAIDFTRMNPLVGPIAVEGLRPGEAVSIEILDVSPGPFGWTAVFPGFGLLADDGFGPALLTWDVRDGEADAAGLGLRIPIMPFLGVIGTCPNEQGTLPVGPPRRTGGNLDTRQLTAGATLYLPVEVDSGLLGLGDPHARQGDGEVCGTALECAASAVVRVKRGAPTIAPAFVPGRDSAGDQGWFATTGIETDLMEASRAAVRRLIEWVARQYGIGESVAYMLCSVLADLRITEVVDRPNWVVSAFWPSGLVERSRR